MKRINGNLNAEKVASLSYMSKATQMIAETTKQTTEYSGAREKAHTAVSMSMEPKKVSTYIAHNIKPYPIKARVIRKKTNYNGG